MRIIECMKKFLPLVLFAVLGFQSVAQKVTLNPTISPALFQPDDAITVTYDVTGTTLASLTNAWIWVWIPGKSIDALYNVNPASSDATKTNNAKFTKSTSGSSTFFSITFTPSAFFGTSISSETQLGILLKGNDWANGQTTDFITTFWDGNFEVKLTSPAQLPVFIQAGETLSIAAETPVVADFELQIDNVVVDTQNGITNYSYNHLVSELSGSVPVVLTATAGASVEETSFVYLIRSPSEAVARPTGIIPGINYHSGDVTKTTLCLWAPLKTSVYVRGDFSNWEILPENKMKRDGEFFWIEVSGLTAGEEYGFQYLVDEELFIADPYADKILDPDDQYILASTYPDLKQFPPQASQADWYFNRVAVLQTNQLAYAWEVPDFDKPAKERLVVYELLIRDIFDVNNRNYETLIDTLSYLERLGINAVELMPIMEFNGNESWGYNPAFMFAPDKNYGTKNMLKKFVDECHKRGIAVILDIALNHQDLPNPYALMYFEFGADGTYGKPTADNPWFNRDPKHPFNVFYDMNHESAYTKAYLDTINHYWLNEFKVDGFRFDLSKGFTQTNNPNNVGAWGAYDATRVALLKRMADQIWLTNPEAYVILEHFGGNQEEKELAEYRAGEGKGMMLWSAINHSMNQNTMGYAEDSDIHYILYNNRGWSVPHSIGYMESHDEERLMYKNLTFGKTLGGYSVQHEQTALARMKAANTLFLTLPGPKMIWQFGETGYDQSINRCEDGSINNDCRLSPKPVLWNYMQDPDRNSLYFHIADLLRLRETYSVFTSGDGLLPESNTLFKQATIKNRPYTETPVDESQMNVHVVVNFELGNKVENITFPHTGTWYDYYAYGEAINVTSTSQSMTLKPGEFKLYTDYPIANLITGVEEDATLETNAVVYPNPTTNFFSIQLQEPIQSVQLLSMNGQKITPSRISDTTWNVAGISSGFYVVEIQTSKKIIRTKLIKE